MELSQLDSSDSANVHFAFDIKNDPPSERDNPTEWINLYAHDDEDFDGAEFYFVD